MLLLHRPQVTLLSYMDGYLVNQALTEPNSEWLPFTQVEMAAGRNRVELVTRFRYEHFAFADHLELISLYHDDCIGIDADAKQLRMCRDYGFQLVFAATLRNMLIYCAVRQKTKTALVALRHDNVCSFGIASHEIRRQNTSPR